MHPLFLQPNLEAKPRQGQSPPPTMGHNRGPPLPNPNSWTAYCWHRAHKIAWKSPPREVVRRRLIQAANFGLTYRQYTSIILDRGRHPQALLFDFECLLQGSRIQKTAHGSDLGEWALLPGVVEKLSGLKNCLVVIVSSRLDIDRARSVIDLPNQKRGGAVTGFAVTDDVTALLCKHNIPHAAAIMVGEHDDHRTHWEAATFGKFISSHDYFRQITK